MENLPRFIKIGKDRVDINEIISYGVEGRGESFCVYIKDCYGEYCRRDWLLRHHSFNGKFDVYKCLADWDKFFSENGLKWFIKLGDHRIRISEIVAYGIFDADSDYRAAEYDRENNGGLFVSLKRNGGTFNFSKDKINIGEKLAELDRLFLGD